MKEKIKLSGVPETMLQTIYARAKESRGPVSYTHLQLSLMFDSYVLLLIVRDS